MRRDLVIAVAGAAVIVLASVGLVTGALREGPLETELAPVGVPVTATGAYQARGPSDLSGVCLQPPCTPRTVVDVLVAGLPDGVYRAALVGPDTRIDLGVVATLGDRHRVHHVSEADHRDKDRLELTFHSQMVWALPLPDAPSPTDIDAAGTARIPTPAGTFHATEIGGVSVSTTARGHIPGEPAPGARYHAWFEGTGGFVDLGALDTEEGGATLDARVERLRLEDQRTVWVYLEVATDAPPGDRPSGFPVLRGEL